MAHLAGGLERVEGFRDFFRLHQRVGPVQEQHVEVVGVQALQNAVDGLENVLFREIVHLAGHDAAFRLENQLVAGDAALADEIGEDLLRAAARVDVGVVEEVEAEVERGAEVFRSLLPVRVRKAHAAECEHGHVHAGFAEFDRFHSNTILPSRRFL